jgi:hypothetical protein
MLYRARLTDHTTIILMAFPETTPTAPELHLTHWKAWWNFSGIADTCPILSDLHKCLGADPGQDPTILRVCGGPTARLEALVGFLIPFLYTRICTGAKLDAPYQADHSSE